MSKSKTHANVLKVSAVAFIAFPLVMGCASVAAVVGANFAATKWPADLSRFELIETAANGESDIRDYDLTADDCRAALIQIAATDRRSAARFTCRPAASVVALN
jgi:hypothetical protein